MSSTTTTKDSTNSTALGLSSPALSYTLRIAAIVFFAEALIMLFLIFVPIENAFLNALFDSIALTLILTPLFYKLVYLPIITEVKLRRKFQKELEEANIKLEGYTTSLKESYDIKDTQLKNIDAQYSAILESLNDIVIICDSEMNIVLWNNKAEETFGYSREDVMGKNVNLIVPDSYRIELEKRFRQFIQTGELRHNKLYNVEGLKRDGTLIPIEISLSAYRVNGSIFVTAIIRDIRGRRIAEEQIKHQIDRLAALRNIDMAITGSLDLHVILNVLLEQVSATLHVDAVDILLCNPNTLRLEHAASRGFRTKVLQHSHLRLGEGYAGRTALEGRTIYIENLQKDAGDFLRAPLLSEEGFITYCCAPLISKGNIKGVIEMFHRTKVDMNQDFLDFVEALASQAAIAVDNASLFNDLHRANTELSLAYETTLEGWSHALDHRDKETEGHSQRVTEMTVRLARDMGMSEEALKSVRRGALLHDIGKMGVPDPILLKPGPLTEEEWKIMRMHPVYARDLLLPITYLKSAIDIPYYHHERWDGKGYPRELKGEEIPLSARIFALVDVYDALQSDRPYRSGWPKEQVIEHIKSLSGSHFDPNVVEAFLKSEMDHQVS